MIAVKKLVKKYKDFNAVDGIDFEIDRGEIVGFLGPNGAGKTTTMRLLTRFLEPTSGSILIDGIDALKDTQKCKERIGYLPENTPLYTDMTVSDFLRFAAQMRGIKKGEIKKRIQSVVDQCGLSEKIYQSISKLSKGYKQRVGLANALIADPDILILDEPTSGLDPNQVVEIRKLIKEIGKTKTIILSTHILSEVDATCDRVLIIHRGSIVAMGTPEELRRQSQGKAVVKVIIEADQRDAASILRQIEGVVGVKTIFAKDAKLQNFELESQTGYDIRKQVISSLMTNNFSLLEICRSEASLEDVFAQLTSD